MIKMILLILSGLSVALMASTVSGERETETAIFAGGCFWCMEPPFEKIDGVEEVIVGYTGGEEEEPTYQEVSSGRTGHLEAVQVIFDPDKVSYQELLEVFWSSLTNQ